VKPLTESDLKILYLRMKTYRYIFWIYVVSGFLYAFACFGTYPVEKPIHLPLADIALLYGVVGVACVLIGRRVAFGRGAIEARRLENWGERVQYIFMALLFLLGAGESLGLAAVTVAAIGGGPGWKLLFLPLWQLLTGLLLSPTREHWDGLLSKWESVDLDGGKKNGA